MQQSDDLPARVAQLEETTKSFSRELSAIEHTVHDTTTDRAWMKSFGERTVKADRTTEPVRRKA